MYLLFFAGNNKKDDTKLFEDIVKYIINIKSLILICKIVDKIVLIEGNNKRMIINVLI